VYFGVPVANFAGWAVLGTTIAAGWLWIETRVGVRPPPWGRWVPGGAWHPVAVYYLVLLFNLSVTALVAEAALVWAGVVAHLPLAAAVVSCVGSFRPADGEKTVHRVGAA
jgi:putative membrane protein